MLSVVPGRVELPTSTLSVWRSNQLSYRTVQLTTTLDDHQLAFCYHLRLSYDYEFITLTSGSFTTLGYATNVGGRLCDSHLLPCDTSQLLLSPQVLAFKTRFYFFRFNTAATQKKSSNLSSYFCIYRVGRRPRTPERRCSSHTFRYGYLVTT